MSCRPWCGLGSRFQDPRVLRFRARIHEFWSADLRASGLKGTNIRCVWKFKFKTYLNPPR